MKKQPIKSCQHDDLEGFNVLADLALDLLWSWNHRADQVWQMLNPEIWELTHNPWVVLQTVSRDKLKQLLSDSNFSNLVDSLVEERNTIATTPGWFQKTHPKSPLTSVAYFSMEYMLSEALPIYSGGLGNVAGDQLKSASDLGVPVVAIGLLYQQGYFRQIIDSNGDQQALYPYNDPGQLPITPLRKANGEWLRLEIALPGWSIWIRTWQVTVGKVKLFLLDSNDAANYPAHRGITSELYGGDLELRLKQELILGICGWRLLDALGIKPEVCHLNEGHAAFVILERAHRFMIEAGVSFQEALQTTRAGNLFTTHTAVAAGFDLFSPSLIEKYLGKYVQDIGISMKELLALGRRNPDDPSEPFNMAYLALHGSRSVNGVSLLHEKVSRDIFQTLFPRWPNVEVPIEHVTNGVHMPSWDSISADHLWSGVCGKERWLGLTEPLEKTIKNTSDESLWKMRIDSRTTLIEFSRNRLRKLLEARGAPQEEIQLASNIFDPNRLTLGFARRFATYKRPNLLLHNPDRLLKILTNAERPVQLILAGKAHPADKEGQVMIKQWMEFIKLPEARPHVVFLSDYDMLLTEQLVQGVDVWINTPRRPWEACGTSGMKVLVNGGLNLSELDGWWAEAYTPKVGWALGDGKEHNDTNALDAIEAEELYTLLEQQVIPEFYNQNAQGLPIDWIKRVRESMSTLTPHYSANRAVREYTEEYYIPAASTYRERANNSAQLGKQIAHWQQELKEKWPTLRFDEMKCETQAAQHHFEVKIFLGELDPNSIKVELYENINGNRSKPQEMALLKQVSFGLYLYEATVPSLTPIDAYTPRIVPSFQTVVVPLEAPYILWQR